jgi:hypothetical protein
MNKPIHKISFKAGHGNYLNAIVLLNWHNFTSRVKMALKSVPAFSLNDFRLILFQVIFCFALVQPRKVKLCRRQIVDSLKLFC